MTPVIEEPVVAQAARVEEPVTALSTFQLAAVTEPQNEAPELSKAELPQDTILVQYEPADQFYDFERLQVTVFDSPWDDTFNAGDPLKIQVQGEKTGLNRRGHFSTQRSTTRMSLANGDYWTDGAYFETLVIGGSFMKDLGSFEEVAVTVAVDDGPFNRFDEEDILATQILSVPELT